MVPRCTTSSPSYAARLRPPGRRPAAVQGETVPRELRIALDRSIGGRRGPGHHRSRRRARESVGVQRRGALPGAGGVRGPDDFRHRPRGGHLDLRPGRRLSSPTPPAAAGPRYHRGRAAERVEKLSLRMGGAARALVRANDNRLCHRRDVADASAGHVTRRQTQLRAVAGRLHALSPLATLARGMVALATPRARPRSTGRLARHAIRPDRPRRNRPRGVRPRASTGRTRDVREASRATPKSPRS